MYFRWSYAVDKLVILHTDTINGNRFVGLLTSQWNGTNENISLMEALAVTECRDSCVQMFEIAAVLKYIRKPLSKWQQK